MARDFGRLQKRVQMDHFANVHVALLTNVPFIFISVAPSLSSPVPTPSSSTPSLGSFVPRPATLRTKVTLPVVAIVVSSVVVALSIIAVVAVLLLRKRRSFAEGWRVRGYRRHHLSEWETTVSIKS